MIKKLSRRLDPLKDLLLLLPLFFAGIVMKRFRRIGAHRLPLSRACLLWIGVFPIRDHYYEPMFHPRHLRFPLDTDRDLPGIDWNDDGQLALLETMNYANEIEGRWHAPGRPPQFHIDNGSFGPGDADYWYNVVRHFKPARIIEIGSGHSTLVARQAIDRNRDENPEYACEHICIEPYERPWLEKVGIRVLRDIVEEVDVSLFNSLQQNDILFIDSSHVIRPQGDVMTEILQIMPRLAKGVVVHLHDIFTPRDYPKIAMIEAISFWNEQYLLEAFLTHNHDWQIIGALNYLQHKHHEALKSACPYVEGKTDPGSFYIQRV